MSDFKYYSPSDFVCECCDESKVSLSLINKLNAMCNELGYMLTVNSSVRCKTHNYEVGGSETSSHLPLCYALDVEALTSRQRYGIIKAAMNAGFNRIGIGHKFIHLDCDPGKDVDVCWLYL